MLNKVAYLKWPRPWRGWTGASFLLFFVMLFTGTINPAYASANVTDTQVAVNLGQTLGVVPLTAIGVNDAVWDGNLLNQPIPGLLRSAGVRVMRYPGGSTSDAYHWQTNTLDTGGNAGLTSFDKFMQVARSTGAQPIITVNYGSGSPQEAAAWVKYANVEKHYNIKYWEIGNEIYGNGSYGANWEYDLHAQKGPAAYATNALQFIQAMKAADPTIQIGGVLTSPGDWPDGVIAAGDTQDWNHTVLSILGAQVDFAAVHWYTDTQQPGNETDAGLLTNSQNIPAKVATLHALFNQYCGPKASSEQIMVTETNSVPYNPGKQTTSVVNALFLAQDYVTWLENGVANVDWWDVHNSIVTGTNDSSSLYGNTNYGDYGLLSAGFSANGISEPPTDTPFPDYYGLQLVHKLLSPGDTMVGATTSQSLVKVFAVKRIGGQLAIMLINTDPSASYNVQIAVPGHDHLADAHVYSYGENSTAVSETDVHGAAARSILVAPYSLTTVLFTPGNW